MPNGKYMYGITDIKFPGGVTELETLTSRKIKKPLDSYKFSLPPELMGVNRTLKAQVPRRNWATPDKLVQISQEACLPPVFKWTNVDVSHWLDKLGFPQYRNTFFTNFINGRTLLLVDASALSAMNVKRFDHIKIITKAIRDLYQVELILFKRSISLPPRYPETHFKFYHIQTGIEHDKIRSSDLWRDMKILREPPIYEIHWDTLERWLKHIPNYQTERIGYAPRRNLYKVKKEPPARKVIEHSKEPCECIPPCECKWAKKSIRPPWTLEYLKNIIPEEDDDLMTCVLDAKFFHTKNEVKCGCKNAKTKPKSDKISIEFNKSKCIPPCECKWTEKELALPSVISVLKVKMARRYTIDINERYSFEIDKKLCERIRCSEQLFYALYNSSMQIVPSSLNSMK